MPAKIDCDKLHKDVMLTALSLVQSPSSRQNLLDLWRKIPYMPVPDFDSESWSPDFLWGGQMFCMGKDYLDFPDYFRWMVDYWMELTEEEFITEFKSFMGLP